MRLAAKVGKKGEKVGEKSTDRQIKRQKVPRNQKE